jgi:hypothetical protein
MEIVYFDQVQKLDIKVLMARVLKAGRTDNYRVTLTMNNWPQIEGRDNSNQLMIDITLNRSVEGSAGAPRGGQMLLKFVLPDGGEREQMLQLWGTPATRRSWRWRTTCPYNGERVQTLYFSPAAQQFVSGKAAGLKYRPSLPNAGYRHLDRMLLYMNELGMKHRDDWRPKPEWMTQARSDFLIRELAKEDIRRLSTMLGIGVMDFHDEEHPTELASPLEPLPVNEPQSLAMYYVDRRGTIQIKARYKQKYGLPKGA